MVQKYGSPENFQKNTQVSLGDRSGAEKQQFFSTRTKQVIPIVQPYNSNFMMQMQKFEKRRALEKHQKRDFREFWLLWDRHFRF